MAEVKTRTFILTSAKFYKRNEKNEEIAYVKGDRVPLTEREYAAYSNMFGEEVSDSSTKPQLKEPGQAPLQRAEQKTEPKPSGVVPGAVAAPKA